MCYECVMLFGRDSVKGLEPMCIMGGSVLDSPFLHCLRNDICGRLRKLAAGLHNIFNFHEDIFRKPLFHFSKVEHPASEQFFYIKYFAHCDPLNLSVFLSIYQLIVHSKIFFGSILMISPGSGSSENLTQTFSSAWGQLTAFMHSIPSMVILSLSLTSFSKALPSQT